MTIKKLLLENLLENQLSMFDDNVGSSEKLSSGDITDRIRKKLQRDEDSGSDPSVIEIDKFEDIIPTFKQYHKELAKNVYEMGDEPQSDKLRDVFDYFKDDIRYIIIDNIKDSIDSSDYGDKRFYGYIEDIKSLVDIETEFQERFDVDIFDKEEISQQEFEEYKEKYTEFVKEVIYFEDDILFEIFEDDDYFYNKEKYIIDYIMDNNYGEEKYDIFFMTDNFNDNGVETIDGKECIYLERVIDVEDLEEDLYEGHLGIYWSYVAGGGESYQGSGGDIKVTFKVYVPLESVNWWETFYKLIYDLNYETEVELLSDSIIYLKEIETSQKLNSGNYHYRVLANVIFTQHFNKPPYNSTYKKREESIDKIYRQLILNRGRDEGENKFIFKDYLKTKA